MASHSLMLTLNEIKTGDRILVMVGGTLSFAEVIKIEAGAIYTDDGRIWSRDDGTAVFWQSHLAEGRISQDPAEWEWLEAQHRKIEAEEKRAEAKDQWLNHHAPGRKKRR